MTQIACLHCDLLVNNVDVEKGQSAICPRCHQTIYLDQQSFTTSLALLVTALLIYFPAMTLPFLSMEIGGQAQQVNLLSSITTIAHGEMFMLAITVLFLVIIFPLIKIVGLLLVMFPLSQDKLPFFGVSVVRYLISASPWSMVEVYLVGVLVALVKLTGMATITLSGGFYAFILLIIINALISINLPNKRIWQRISHIQQTPLTARVTPPQTDSEVTS